MTTIEDKKREEKIKEIEKDIKRDENLDLHYAYCMTQKHFAFTRLLAEIKKTMRVTYCYHCEKPILEFDFAYKFKEKTLNNYVCIQCVSYHKEHSKKPLKQTLALKPGKQYKKHTQYYVCLDCNNKFKRTTSIASKGETKCSNCRSINIDHDIDRG